MNSYHKPSRALVLCILLPLADCGGSESADRASAGDAPAADASASGSDGLDRCALLTDAEIQEAVGPHNGGSTGLENEWGTMSCRWTADRAQTVEGYPDGWHDAIEVAVFQATDVPMIRQQVRGDPVEAALPNATYDGSYGEIWFDCPSGRLCVVKARTASGDRRQDIATKLAGLVNSRLR